MHFRKTVFCIEIFFVLRLLHSIMFAYPLPSAKGFNLFLTACSANFVIGDIIFGHRESFWCMSIFKYKFGSTTPRLIRSVIATSPI